MLGESGSSSSQLALGDALRLHTEAPWPLSLIITPAHIGQYSQVWSVLLRLRRTLLQLQRVWRCVGGRMGRSSSAEDTLSITPAPGAALTADKGLQPDQGLQQQRRQRMQQLRLWNHLACHAVASLQGFMQGQLAGRLAKRFEKAVCAAPVSVLEMRAAHGALLEAARACCLLPGTAAGAAGITEAVSSTGGTAAAGSGAGGRLHGGRPGASSSWAGGVDSTASGGCSAAAHGLVELCWDWQAALMGQLRQQGVAGARDGTDGAAYETHRAGPGDGVSDHGWAWLQDDTAWEGVAVLGRGVEDGIAALRVQLMHATGASGHALADLLVRLGPAGR